MVSRNKKTRPNLRWQTMDARDMGYFENHKFDVIIDKSTLDTLLCGNSAYLNVGIMLKECQRVLKTGGVYIVISYSPSYWRNF